MQYEFGVVGAVLVGIAAILVVVSFTAVDWFGRGAMFRVSNALNFDETGSLLDNAGGFGSALSGAYFSWLGWLLLIAVVAIGVVANVPGPAALPMRVFGAVLSAAAITLTIFALRLLQSDQFGYLDYLKHARVGFNLALIGFLLAGIGALLGPTRRAY